MNKNLNLHDLAFKNYHEEESIIHVVDQLLLQAVKENVSDIHIEPYEKYCRVRFRTQGMLYESTRLHSTLATRIISRLKIMSKINIAEHRMPQDGHVYFTRTNSNIRVNTCPTLFGEKLVLRLLHDNADIDLDNLGLTEWQQKILIEQLNQPQGLILVTGPTGSGKTNTLYAALKYLNKTHKNIYSVENPVEIKFDGINQINIDSKIGLGFDVVLRALLRQDPDIIMVGEIRDKETAKIAIEAAQTGHLVLSTLHTNTATDTILRLLTLGIPIHYLLFSLSLIISQRLVRTLCPCQKNNFEINTACTCHEGYNGRCAIFELLPFTNAIKHLTAEEMTIKNIMLTLKKQQWPTLFENGLEKIKIGITNFPELKRVLGDDCLN